MKSWIRERTLYLDGKPCVIMEAVAQEIHTDGQRTTYVMPISEELRRTGFDKKEARRTVEKYLASALRANVWLEGKIPE